MFVCSLLFPQLGFQSSSAPYKSWTLLQCLFYRRVTESARFDLCKCLSSVNMFFNTSKNRRGKQHTRRYWRWQGPEIPLRADQSWNVTQTSWVQQEGGKYSWHTNRKWLEPPHNGVSCASPPRRTNSSLLTYSPPPSLISQNPPSSHPALYRRHLPQQPFHLSSYSSLHILISSLRTHLILTLSQKLEWKQEVINQWSVPSGRKTNCWAVSCFS